MRRRPGQALAIVALLLPLLLLLLLGAVEVGARALQRAEVEDSLQQAARVSVQIFDYAAFASNQQAVRPEDVRSAAEAFFIQNLSAASGLPLSAPAYASRVSWTVIEAGGSCFVGTPAAITFDQTPAICGHLRAPLGGLTGMFGTLEADIFAAATLDRGQP